jgi:hypothetical protein
VTILYDEPRVLLVPRDHRPAVKESVTLNDIADKPMLRLADSMRNVYWRVDPVGDRNRLVAAFAKHTRDSITDPGSDAESPA